jgi:ATP-dependent Clp protease ATP-binding subunit ClpA
LNYARKWKDLRNAIAFAVECAKIARPYYKGKRAKDVDRAIDLADRFARGEHITANAAAYAVGKASNAANATAYAAYAASNAADAANTAAAANAAANAVYAAADAAAASAVYAAASAAEAAAAAAAHAANVAEAQVTEAFYKWTAIDLGTVFGTEPWHAAMALLKIGNGEAIVKAYLEGRS